MVGDNYRMSPNPLIYDLDLHRLCTQGADKILFYRSYEGLSLEATESITLLYFEHEISF